MNVDPPLHIESDPWSSQEDQGSVWSEATRRLFHAVCLGCISDVNTCLTEGGDALCDVFRSEGKERSAIVSLSLRHPLPLAQALVRAFVDHPALRKSGPVWRELLSSALVCRFSQPLVDWLLEQSTSALVGSDSSWLWRQLATRNQWAWLLANFHPADTASALMAQPSSYTVIFVWARAALDPAELARKVENRMCRALVAYEQQAAPIHSMKSLFDEINMQMALASPDSVPKALGAIRRLIRAGSGIANCPELSHENTWLQEVVAQAATQVAAEQNAAALENATCRSDPHPEAPPARL